MREELNVDSAGMFYRHYNSLRAISKTKDGQLSAVSDLAFKANDGFSIRPVGSKELRLTFKPVGAKGAEGKLLPGGRAVYEGAFAGTDLLVSADQNRLTQTLVLRDPTSPSEFSWKVNAEKLTVKQTALTQSAFVDAAGNTRFTVPEATLVSADGSTQRIPLGFAPDGTVSLRFDQARLVYPALLHISLQAAPMGLLAAAPEVIKAKVMVLVDTSGSMLWDFSTTTGEDEDNIAKDADENGVFCDNDLPGSSFECDSGEACTVANGANTEWRITDFSNPSRMYATKEALQNVVNAHAGLLDFGLMRYIEASWCANTSYCCTPATGGTTAGRCGNRDWYDALDGFSNNDDDDGLSYAGGCGDDFGGGRILQLTTEPGYQPVPAANILQWIDHEENFCDNGDDAPRDPELRGAGPTPLTRAIRTALKEWYEPILNATQGSGLDDPLLNCRPYVFVAMTDGADTCTFQECNDDGDCGSDDCDSGVCACDGDGDCSSSDGFSCNGGVCSDPQPDPSTEVGFLTAANPTNPVKTYVLGMGNPAGLDVDELDEMAVAGGTGPEAALASNQTEIEAAFADIVAGTVKFETCNTLDDNCNERIDEGLNVYQECEDAGDCGSGTCDAGRCTCSDSGDCSSGFACAGDGFCRPNCAVGRGQCRREGVRKCGAQAGQCCVDDGSASCTPLTAGEPDTEVCNGVDDNCDGQVDEGFPDGCGGCTPLPEICDGIDNDCDGAVDTDDSDLVGVGEACGNNVGVCKPGTTLCVDGEIVCDGDTPPGTEVCNGLDDDCDGTVDGQARACYTGPIGTENVGICRGGTQVCVADKFQDCGGAGECTSNSCDAGRCTCASDADCDADSGFSCDTTQNLCVKLPGEVCDEASEACWGACNGEIIPTTEVCNGLDDNCNGTTDGVGETLVDPGNMDGPTIGDSCCGPSGSDTFCEADPCENGATCNAPCMTGAWQCVGNVAECTGWVGPDDEICDGIDNDCDGTPDEAEDLPAVGQACISPGACTGITQCVAVDDTYKIECVAGDTGSLEVCDGLDNDCDGSIDELPDVIDNDTDTEKPLGEDCWPGGVALSSPCEPGEWVCQGGERVCESQGVEPEEETCDGVDNDCDGVVDGPSSCEGSAICVNGEDCAPPCKSGEFKCPPGRRCEAGFCVLVDSGTGGSTGSGGASATGGATGIGGNGGAGANDGVGGSIDAGVGGMLLDAGTDATGPDSGSGASGTNGSNTTSDRFGLATGGGGCSVSRSSTHGQLAWLVFGLALGGAFVRRRQGQRRLEGGAQ